MIGSQIKFGMTGKVVLIDWIPNQVWDDEGKRVWDDEGKGHYTSILLSQRRLGPNQ